MANTELVNYIRQQISLGETETPIKNSLRSVGWAEADINDAFKEATPPAQSAAPATPTAPATPATPATNYMGTSPSSSPRVSAEPQVQTTKPFVATSPFGASPLAAKTLDMKPAELKTAAAKPIEEKKVINIDNLNGSAKDLLFEPKQAQAPASTHANVESFFSKTQMAPKESAAPISMATMEPKKSKTGFILNVVLGVLVILLAGFSVYLFLSNQSLKTNAGTAANTSDLAAKLAEANGKVNQLTTNVSNLSQANADLLSQLAIFVLPQSTTATSSTQGTSLQSITVRGTLNGGDKVAYTLVTSQGIVLNLKNGKDAKVDALLKPLIGNQIEITGTHVPGSRDITLTHINGSAIPK